MVASLILMTMAAFGAIGWLVGFVRKGTPWWVKGGAFIGLPLLIVYFVILLLAAQPTLESDDVETGWFWTVLMVGGVCAMLASPVKPKADQGGALSA